MDRTRNDTYGYQHKPSANTFKIIHVVSFGHGQFPSKPTYKHTPNQARGIDLGQSSADESGLVTVQKRK